MIEKILIEFKFKSKALIFSMSICIFLLIIGFYVCVSSAGHPPISIAYAFFAIPLLVLLFMCWRLVRGRSLALRLNELYNSCRVIGDRVVLPGVMRVKFGKIIVKSIRKPRGSASLLYDFREMKSFEANELTIPKDEDYTILIGRGYGVYMELPAYIIDEPKFKSIIGNIVIIMFRPLNLEIDLSHYERYLSYNSDYVVVDFRIEDSLLRGKISLYTSTEPKIRSARIEMKCNIPAEKHSKIVLAKVDQTTKSSSFSYDFQLIKKPVAIFSICNPMALRPDKIVKELNLMKPIFQGVINEKWNLELRTILDIPLMKDVISKTDLTVTKTS